MTEIQYENDDVRTAVLVYRNGEPKIVDGLCYFCYEDTFEEFHIPADQVAPYLHGPPVKWQFEKSETCTELVFNTVNETTTQPVTDPLKSSSKASWDSYITQILIELYKEYRMKVEMGTVHSAKRMWEIIAEKLLTKGYAFTPLQAENRWKTLERAYKRVSTKPPYLRGSISRRCAYEKELEEILRDKFSRKSAVPVTSQSETSTAISTTSGLNNSTAEFVEIKTVSFEDKSIESGEEDKNFSTSEKILIELQKLREEITKKEAATQKRHQEKMALLKERNLNDRKKIALFAKLIENNQIN